ncbi:MAG: biopolymer transporter ExbD [Lentisphaeria bacterium]|nr:biopolymer transporter ExbD [Lentisphaeria bacterium]MBQ7394333.1 biopolymer transporter ExbD [Lentisphaeria bacterium]
MIGARRQNGNDKTPVMRRIPLKCKPLSGMPPMIAVIDIFFLTLFFFMLSSSFVQVSGIKVDLPRAETTVSADIEKFIVTIAWSAEGPKLFFNDRPVTHEELKEDLAKISGISRSAMIVIRADRRIPFEPVSEIMTMAEKAQLASFIAVMPQRKDREAVFNKEK